MSVSSIERSNELRIHAQILLVGALITLAGCNQPLPTSKPAGPPPTQMAIPSREALRASLIPASISIGSARQAVQFPIRILQNGGSGSIDTNQIGDWEPGEAIYVYLDQGRTLPLTVVGQTSSVVIYLDTSSRVTAIVGLDPATVATPASIPTYSSAIIVRLREAYLDAITIGDLATLPPNSRIGAQSTRQPITTIAIPPVGTLEPYPYGSAVLPGK